MWLGPSHRQAKRNGKTLELIGLLTFCEDTKKTCSHISRDCRFDTQSVKSTNKAMLRYTHAKSTEAHQLWRS